MKDAHVEVSADRRTLWFIERTDDGWIRSRLAVGPRLAGVGVMVNKTADGIIEDFHVWDYVTAADLRPFAHDLVKFDTRSQAVADPSC